MKLALVPAYLVYDGFDNNLDAACHLKRVMANKVTTTDCGEHLHCFLRACLSTHNAGGKNHTSRITPSLTLRLSRHANGLEKSSGNSFPPLKEITQQQHKSRQAQRHHQDTTLLQWWQQSPRPPPTQKQPLLLQQQIPQRTQPWATCWLGSLQPFYKCMEDPASGPSRTFHHGLRNSQKRETLTHTRP